MSATSPGYIFGIGPLAFALAWILTAAATPLLRRFIMDQPNERSSHVVPTPRGGGIGLMGALLPLWALTALLIGDTGAAVTALYALGLAALGLMDDIRGMPVLLRLMTQAVFVGLGLQTLPEGSLVFQGFLPPWADTLVTAFAWLWFINLFNFMDGTDGIASVEAAGISIGIAALILFDGGATISLNLNLITAGAALGFLMLNWSPARVFMGDVGSVPLGFLLGWLLIDLAVSGYWAAALILPAYFLFDATLTLLRRIAKGEPFWRAHRSHFYQQAAARWGSHRKVALWVILLNLALIRLAIETVMTERIIVALVAASMLTLGIIIYFADKGRRANGPGSDGSGSDGSGPEERKSNG